MHLIDDRYYFGNVPGFLSLVKLLNNDPEFRLALDFGAGTLEIESMMMAGVIGMGIRLIKSPLGIIAPSPTTRTDRVTLKVDSAAFHRTFLGLNNVPYAYMSLWIVDDVCIHLETFGSDHVSVATATMNTMTLDEDDTDFVVTADTMKTKLHYDFIAKFPGSVWRRYVHASTVDTKVRYSVQQRRLTWQSTQDQTTMSLYLAIHPNPLVNETDRLDSDVLICLLPTVVAVIRSVLQTTDKYMVTISISDDLPIGLFAPLDSVGSFIRVYAGTKDDN
jgi:hypothetical protein